MIVAALARRAHRRIPFPEERMRRSLGLIGVLLASAHGSAQQPSPAVTQEIFAARDSVWRAWFANDTALLRRVLPAAAVAAEGRPEAQWADRGTIMGQSRDFARSGARLDDITFENTRVTLDGDVALVTSNYRLVMRGDRRVDSTRGHAVELFVRDRGRWVNPFWRLGPVTPPGREIPLPDTLGADFPIADSATKQATLADYDALMGVWEFRFQSRNPDGTFSPAFPGHWAFEKKPGGRLIEDRWRPDNPTQPMEAGTYTYRTFDPNRQIWRIIGMNSNGGEFALGLTWTDGTDRLAIQHDGNAIMRIRYMAIAPNHFLWRADRTTDGGRTWLLDAWTMEAKRIAK
jgi:hypothetical protein